MKNVEKKDCYVLIGMTGTAIFLPQMYLPGFFFV